MAQVASKKRAKTGTFDARTRIATVALNG